MVINISSMAGLGPGNNAPASSYFAAKAAVVGLTKTMGSAEVFQAEGVQVKALCPWFADTNILNDDKEWIECLRWLCSIEMRQLYTKAGKSDTGSFCYRSHKR